MISAPSIDDQSVFIPRDSDQNIVNPTTGLLSKLADTVVDLAGLAGAKALGFTYPTGQVNPASVDSQKQANRLQAGLTNAQGVQTVTNYQPYIIMGLAGLALVTLIVVSKKK